MAVTREEQFQEIIKADIEHSKQIIADAEDFRRVNDQVITDNYAAYNGDCISVMNGLKSESVHLSVYSPPFCGLYHYSSSDRDLSNCRDYDEFFAHYDYSSSDRDLSNCRDYNEFFAHYDHVISEITRVTLPGRCSAVHCMDVPDNGANVGGDLIDFPGDIIRAHKRHGWSYAARYSVWKEPLEVRNRTMAKGLSHRQMTEDSTLCDVASADYVLLFRKKGENPIPVEHYQGLLRYAGSRTVPPELIQYRGWKGNQIENRFSHWIWRQYASAFWDDVRLERVLPYREARESEDERHMHPLQLDVIERTVVLRSNPGEVVLTPFMGVGSECYGALINGRKAIGAELKPSYFRQAIKNLASAKVDQDFDDDDRQMTIEEALECQE